MKHTKCTRSVECLSEHMTYIIVLQSAKPTSVQKVHVLDFISINPEKLISI